MFGMFQSSLSLNLMLGKERTLSPLLFLLLQLTAREVEKKKRRREQNRRAAHKCREKKREQQTDLISVSAIMINSLTL